MLATLISIVKLKTSYCQESKFFQSLSQRAALVEGVFIIIFVWFLLIFKKIRVELNKITILYHVIIVYLKN